jgi:hypothetical protein
VLLSIEHYRNLVQTGPRIVERLACPPVVRTGRGSVRLGKPSVVVMTGLDADSGLISGVDKIAVEQCPE